MLAPHFYCPAVRTALIGSLALAVTLLARREAVAHARHELLIHCSPGEVYCSAEAAPWVGSGCSAAQVSGANYGYKPSLGQYSIYNKTFGYLTGKGFCHKGKCRVYAGILDEFG